MMVESSDYEKAYRRAKYIPSHFRDAKETDLDYKPGNRGKFVPGEWVIYADDGKTIIARGATRRQVAEASLVARQPATAGKADES